jgi:threonine dehydrogenase-like Zn-dependent dehydrogenase
MVIADVSDPGPARAGNVILRPEAVGICGSDFHLFSGDVGALSGARNFYPRIQGHEVSAIVEDPGDTEVVAAGQRVAIWPLLPEELTHEIQDWTDGDGPPLVVETSGETNVLPQAVDLTSPAGRVVVVGMSSATAAVRPGVFPEKEIDVIGSSCAKTEDFLNAVQLVSANRASLAALFSHHFPLTHAAEAFEFARSRPPDAIKIVVTVN